VFNAIELLTEVQLCRIMKAWNVWNAILDYNSNVKTVLKSMNNCVDFTDISGLNVVALSVTIVVTANSNVFVKYILIYILKRSMMLNTVLSVLNVAKFMISDGV